MHLRSLAAGLCVSVFAAACSGQSETEGAVPTQTTVDPAPFVVSAGTEDSSRPALWRVSDDDTTVFLFGTVHILRPNTDWLRDDVLEAVRDADAIYFEADVESTSAQTILVQAVTDLGLYTDGSTLSDRLDEEEQQEVAEALEILGIPPSGLDNMRPWLASIQMSDVHLTRRGFNRDDGVERVLTQEAKRAGVPTRFLETGAHQVELLASISEGSQIDMLVETARQIEDEPDTLDTMIEVWLEGDTDALGQLVEEDETFVSEEATAIMLTGRNEEWARQIDTLLDNEAGQFVIAVGAAHLVGEDSLQDQLQDFGHTTDRL
ncbi:MAG: TraB/GumN family protein [Pseudomonadota bacterium]